MSEKNPKEEIEKEIIENLPDKNEAKVKQVLEEIKNNLIEDQVEESITNNQFVFDIGEVKFRVSKPSFKQKQLAYKEKAKKFNELIKDESIPFEEDLKATLKKRGIDLDEMDSEAIALEKKKQEVQYSLGELLAHQGSKKDIETLRDEIINIQQSINYILVRKASFLENSLENQLIVHLYSFLTYLIAEREVDGKWVPAWESFEQYCNSDDVKVQKVAFNAAMMIKDEL